MGDVCPKVNLILQILNIMARIFFLLLENLSIDHVIQCWTKRISCDILKDYYIYD